jgi:4-amino-4-deoxychorismate lyase
MRDIIVRTAAVSGKREGSIRYWASAGPGSLGLAPAAGAEPGFFVMISAGLGYPDTWYTQGLRMMTTTYPIKPPLYAVTKSVNYLPNVLMQMEAQSAASTTDLHRCAGNVGELNMNVALITTTECWAPEVRSHPAGLHSLRLARAGDPAPGVPRASRLRHSRGGGARGPRDAAGSAARSCRADVEWDGKPIVDGARPIAPVLQDLC